MSVAVRVIPCLDVDAGRVVKGVNFRDLRDAGDPVVSGTCHGRWLDGPSLLVYPAASRYGIPNFQLRIGERAG